MKITEATLPLGGTTVYYRTAGSGDQHLVLLHGGRFSSRTWQELGMIQSFATAGWRVWALDLPGFGQSPANPIPADRFLAQAFDALGIERCALLSPSMSGRFSLPLLATQPHRLTHFVAAAPVEIRPWLEALDDCPLPVLGVWGELDRTIPVELGRQLIDTVPHGRLEILPGASHPCYLDAPESFLALVLEFLSEPDATSAEPPN